MPLRRCTRRAPYMVVRAAGDVTCRRRIFPAVPSNVLYWAVRLFLALVAATCAVGCVAAHRYRAVPADPAWELLFVAGNGDIQLGPTSGPGSSPLYRSTMNVVLPRCSPDRTRVAFYEFSGHRGALKVADLEGVVSDEKKKWGKTLAEIEGPVGDRMALFPPIWDPDGASLLFIDDGGIQRIWMDRRHETVVVHEGILALSLSPGHDRIAYADGEEISLTTGDGREITRMRTRSASIPGRQEVQPLAFSPDGRRIAYGAGRYLFVLHLASMERHDVIDMEEPIYWVQWLPGQDRLIFITGQSELKMRVSMSSSPIGVVGGWYHLYTVRAEGGGLSERYGNDSVDAHLAQPALSPDGARIALVTGEDSALRVTILATGEPLMSNARDTGMSDFPSWLPPVPGAHGSCPAPSFVVYPLR